MTDAALWLADHSISMQLPNASVPARPYIVRVRPLAWEIIYADGRTSEPMTLIEARPLVEVAMANGGIPPPPPPSSRIVKLQALAGRPGTPGEGAAAEAAIDRITAGAAA